MSISRPNRQRGLSLIELIMFMVIMGVAAAAIMQVINLSARDSADPIRRKQAMLIAEAYMEEMQLARFTACDPADANASTATNAQVAAVATDTSRCASAAGVENLGPEAGNARPFDNINDYVPQGSTLGVAQRAFAVAGVDRDVAGAALGVDAGGTKLGNSALSAITTTVALNAVPSLGPAGLAVSSDATPLGMNALRITITTTYGTGPNDVITLDGYRTRYAPNSQP